MFFSALAGIESCSVDNPQFPVREAPAQRHQTPHAGKDCRLVLSLQSEHHNAAMRARWVRTNVGEVQFQRELYPRFIAHSGGDYIVRRAAQQLFVNRFRVEPRLPPSQRGFNRQILVCLELHTPISSGGGRDTSAAFARFSAEERKAALEILGDTKKNLQAYYSN